MMPRIFDSLYRKAFIVTVAGAVLVIAALNVGSTSFADLFAAWSGTLTGFACVMLALVMFVHGLRRGMRTTALKQASDLRRRRSHAISSAF